MTPENRLRTVNLNLLPMLHAILRHASLTRAAREMNVTQSAASNNLRRLREIFGDELLVKDGREMRLTETARRLVEPLEETIRTISSFLEEKPFSPATARRRFRIATADYVSAVMMPGLLDILAREAPHISVQMLTGRRRAAYDLRAENIDIVIAPREFMGTSLFEARNQTGDLVHEKLFTDGFVCVAREDADLPPTLGVEDYLARPHASFFLDLDTHASLEQAYLQENRISQFDRILSASFSLLPMLAARSDCLALIPDSLARLMAPLYRLRVMASPLPIPDLNLVAVWLKRREGDVELAWMREALKRSVP